MKFMLLAYHRIAEIVRLHIHELCASDIIRPLTFPIEMESTESYPVGVGFSIYRHP